MFIRKVGLLSLGVNWTLPVLAQSIGSLNNPAYLLPQRSDSVYKDDESLPLAENLTYAVAGDFCVKDNTTDLVESDLIPHSWPYDEATHSWWKSMWNTFRETFQTWMGELVITFEDFIEWYAYFLDEYPLLTNAITAGVVGGIGDFFSQLVEVNIVKNENNMNPGRILSIASEGLFISGPLLSIFYEIMEENFPTDSDDSMELWYMVGCQLFIETFLMDTFFVASMMITTAILQGRRKEIVYEMKTAFFPALKASWATSASFMPIHVFVFSKIPLKLRVLVVTVESIFWNAAVSYQAHRARHNEPPKS